MSPPSHLGWADSWSTGGAEGPDRATTGDASWTWDVEFDPSPEPIYARSSIDGFGAVGGSSAGIGVVEYRTVDSSGRQTVHPVGQSGANGVADYVWDTNVSCVTFGWLVEGDDIRRSRINMEIRGPG